jgi:hypothetical protein
MEKDIKKLVEELKKENLNISEILNNVAYRSIGSTTKHSLEYFVLKRMKYNNNIDFIKKLEDILKNHENENNTRKI